MAHFLFFSWIQYWILSFFSLEFPPWGFSQILPLVFLLCDASIIAASVYFAHLAGCRAYFGAGENRDNSVCAFDRRMTYSNLTCSSLKVIYDRNSNETKRSSRFLGAYIFNYSFHRGINDLILNTFLENKKLVWC